MKGMLFRITTGIAAGYHLILGGALLALPAGELTGIARMFLGTELEIDPKLALIGKFVGAYILVFGILLALLFLKPVRLRALMVPALVLFGVRLVNKLVFMTAIEQAFGVTRGRSLFALITLAVIFGIMVWTRPTDNESRVS